METKRDFAVFGGRGVGVAVGAGHILLHPAAWQVIRLFAIR